MAMKTVTGYDFFNKETKFDIIWEEFRADLFNYTFALGIDHADKEELSLLSVRGWMGKDRYDTINTYFLNVFKKDPTLLTECVKKDIAEYVKKCLTARVQCGTLTLEQIERMVK